MTAELLIKLVINVLSLPLTFLASAFVTTSSLTNVVCEKRTFNDEREANNVPYIVENELQKEIKKPLDLNAYAIRWIVL